MFAAGAAIGSAVTWKIVKTKYDRIVQEEIDSIREAFEDNRSNEQCQEDDNTDDEDDASDDETLEQITWDDLENNDEDEDDVQYTRLASTYINAKGGAESMGPEPYVIDPLDFGDLDGYDTVEFTYYADGTLEDEDYNVVTNVDELIGTKSLYTFGEYEEDSVFVRNERLRTDYQILKDYRTYAEARGNGPARVDDE
jgi:hypothetical protein